MIFLGGGVGSLVRFLVTELSGLITDRSWVGIFVVNIIGCLIFYYSFKLFQDERFSTYAIRVGFLGALTTFSTFSYESYRLFNAGRPTEAVISIILNVFFGIIIGFFILNKKVMN